MDSNLQNIILGVAANALTSLLVGVSTIGNRLFEGNIEEAKDLDVMAILKEAPLDAVYTISWEDYPSAEEVSIFLSSPEAEALVRQIFSTQLGRDEKQNNEELKAEFKALLNIHFTLEKDKLARITHELFSAIIKTSSHVLDVAINANSLSAHEIKSTFRYQIIKDELNAIKKNLDFLRTAKNLTYTLINNFETKLKDQIENKHSRIMPPNFDDARKYNIDDIYVMPNFTRQTLNENLLRLLSIEERYTSVWESRKKAFRHLLAIKPAAEYLTQKNELIDYWMRVAAIDTKNEAQLLLPGVESFSCIMQNLILVSPICYLMPIE